MRCRYGSRQLRNEKDHQSDHVCFLALVSNRLSYNVPLIHVVLLACIHLLTSSSSFFSPLLLLSSGAAEPAK